MKEVVDMPEYGNPVCLLALEEKPNSFIPIDLQSLGFDITRGILTLKDIDYLSFTYRVEAIKEAIKKSKIVSESSLSGNLVILYEDNKQKRKTTVIDKYLFENYDIMTMLLSNIDDKEFVNQLINKVKNMKILDDIKSKLVMALKRKEVYIFFEMIETLGYITERKLYLYMIKFIEKKQNAIRVREKNEKKED